MNTAIKSLATALSLSLLTLQQIKPDIETKAVLPVINTWTKETGAGLALRSEVIAREEVPLFNAFPALREHIPHVTLGDFPTPIKQLETLGKQLNHPSIYLKNDGVTGKLFGGNKVRKLEFLLADAIQAGAQRVFTEGPHGSNHTTATIAYATKLGLECDVFLSPQKNTAYLQRNLKLSNYYGGELHPASDFQARQITLLRDFFDYRLQSGAYGYYIPSGGSNEIGCLGFVNAAFELKEQIAAGVMPEPDYIFVAAGSNGTAAGLALGVGLAGLKSQVIAVKTTSQKEGVMEEDLTRLMGATYLRIVEILGHFPKENIPGPRVAHGYFGKLYSEINDETSTAIELMRSTEGIVLDGTYTGKAFAGMVDFIQSQPQVAADKVVLFWNTFCSSPLAEKTSKVKPEELPTSLQHYFSDPLQKGDPGLATA